MPLNRTESRNVHLHNASAGTTLGGFYQQGSLTETNLIWILSNVLLIVTGDWTIKHRESDRTIAPLSNPVVPGNYDIYSEGTIQVSDETWSARLVSHATSGQENAFCNGVRARDGRCVISGRINRSAGIGFWGTYEAAHIFPLQQESLWIQHNYGRWITNMDGSRGSTINSTQNGLLMDNAMHYLFDQYLVSINPDDDYKIIVFMPDDWGIDGRTLDPICRQQDNPDRVSDDILRWHFRQCVLANMRGGGEPIFEHDFPSGSDMMATLRIEPYGKERFEMELATRLGL